MRWVLLLTVLLAQPAAAAALEVIPSRAEAGEQVAFVLEFPQGAEGTAELALGDGRTEQVETVIGSVDVLAAAPSEPGTYTATVRFQVNGTWQEHQASYRVVAAGRDGGAVLLWLGLGVVILGVAAVGAVVARQRSKRRRG